MTGIGIKQMAYVAYAVDDMTEARRFYGVTLGLEETGVLMKEGIAIWAEFEIPGGQTIAIANSGKRWEPDRQGGRICFEVSDIEAAVAQLGAAGVQFYQALTDYPICRMALISDPSGNTLAIHQIKPNHPDYGI